MCEFCDKGKALVIGKTDDVGIAIKYPRRLIAYGYDIHGMGKNGIDVKINFCPICGRDLREKGKKTEKIICRTNPKCEYNPEECFYAIVCRERVKVLDENGYEHTEEKRFWRCAYDKCEKGE